MNKQLTLTQVTEVNDDFDKYLLEEILLIIQNTDTFAVLDFWGHLKFKKDKTGEEFFLKSMLAVNSLVKANALRRNYTKIKDLLIEELSTSTETKNTRVDVLFNKVDAFIQIEAFFSQIKTTLDLLAQSLKPIFGIEFHTFAKKNNINGQEIIDRLNNNLNKDIKSNSTELVELIELHKTSLTKIIKYRDDIIHYGKLRDVQGFRFSVSRNEIIPPLILVTPNKSAYVHEYLDEVLKYLSVFAQKYIFTILSNLIADMTIAKRQDGTWGWQGISQNKLSYL